MNDIFQLSREVLQQAIYVCRNHADAEPSDSKRLDSDAEGDLWKKS
jgi:hypothetical protein